MKIIGITGGVGSGKSEILTYLQTIPGIKVYKADGIAHQLQAPGQPCYEKILYAFGPTILNPDNSINRSALGDIVFNNIDKLRLLNTIIHPEVKVRVQELIQLECTQGTLLFVLEAALLIENGYHNICDELWFIFSTEETRRVRLKKSRDYDDQKINDIIKSQLKESDYRKYCTRVIDNNDSFQYTCEQIKEVLYEVM